MACYFLDGKDGPDGTGWDRGGMEGPTLVGAEGLPSLSVEVQQATGSGGQRQEAVATTNCVGAARAQSICVRAVEQSK